MAIENQHKVFSWLEVKDFFFPARGRPLWKISMIHLSISISNYVQACIKRHSYSGLSSLLSDTCSEEETFLLSELRLRAGARIRGIFPRSSASKNCFRLRSCSNIDVVSSSIVEYSVIFSGLSLSSEGSRPSWRQGMMIESFKILCQWHNQGWCKHTSWPGMV